MSKYENIKIGDEVQVVVTDIIPKTDKNKLKILCDINIEETECSLQYNSAISNQISLINIGDQIDGWIIRKHRNRKFLAVGISDFGRIPPSSKAITNYLEALRYTINYFKQISNDGYEDPVLEALSIVKGLLNRSVKKDQWDWLFIYKSFKFKDDFDASNLRDNYVRVLNDIKNIAKGKIGSSVMNYHRKSIISITDKLEISLSFIVTEQKPWEIIKKPLTKLTSVSISNNRDDEQNNSSEYIQIFKSKIKLERANTIHKKLVSNMSKHLSNNGIQSFYNGLIDLFCVVDGIYYIFEMKSLTGNNERSQIRKAISQLYEYRFIHDLKNSKLIVVLESKPSEEWLIKYLVDDRNIAVTWMVNNSFTTPKGDEYAISKNSP